MDKQIPEKHLWPVFDVEGIEIKDPGGATVYVSINKKPWSIDIFKCDIEFIISPQGVPSKIRIKSFAPELFDNIFYKTLSEDVTIIEFAKKEKTYIRIGSDAIVRVNGSFTFEEISFALAEMERLGWTK
jgi:hypothetical protein